MRLTRRQDAFLDDLCRRSFRFFEEQSDPRTGLVRDRALADSADPDRRPWTSAAATGFGLSAWRIAAERRWVERSEARRRVLAVLRFYDAEEAFQMRGWFYRFVHGSTGERWSKNEVSSIDTSLLLAGMLTARGYFRGDSEIIRLVMAIWRWFAWKRPSFTYGRFTYINGAPTLFTHQYPHAWIDFRGRCERRAPRIDWFENSVVATRAQKQFCLDLAAEFPGCYSENVWGVTASDSAKGYRGWGGPPRTRDLNGSVAPYAAGGSLMFAPEICIPALMEMRERFDDRIYKRYCFVDAFHPTNGWTNPDVLGVDSGITLLSAENLRTGNVWKWFGANPEIRRAMGEGAGLSYQPEGRCGQSG